MNNNEVKESKVTPYSLEGITAFVEEVLGLLNSEFKYLTIYFKDLEITSSYDQFECLLKFDLSGCMVPCVNDSRAIDKLLQVFRESDVYYLKWFNASGIWNYGIPLSSDHAPISVLLRGL